MLKLRINSTEESRVKSNYVGEYYGRFDNSGEQSPISVSIPRGMR
ncbi:hypothetical protein A2U01_0109623, partial [Trifolium medium]|nr:hypothetical protein [Trifolium medium]